MNSAGIFCRIHNILKNALRRWRFRCNESFRVIDVLAPETINSDRYSAVTAPIQAGGFQESKCGNLLAATKSRDGGGVCHCRNAGAKELLEQAATNPVINLLEAQISME